jgi:hypothetical protein
MFRFICLFYTLTFLGNILQDKTTIEFQIVEKQHAMMKTNTQNYANVITNILRKYRLPELYNHILQDIIPLYPVQIAF